MVEGYAATVNGEIDIRTVHDSEEGAKVNGLLVIFKITVTRSWSRSMIDQAWATHVAYQQGGVNIGIVPVTVAISTDRGS